jgi:plastocyanin
MCRTATVLAVLLAACSNSSPPPSAVVPTPVDPATAGSIEVSVTYAGAVPPPKTLDMRSAAQCAAAHTEPVFDQSLVVQDGHLANAVVWIKDGLQGWVFAPPTAPAIIDQKGCIYEPHVAAAMVGQPVQFLNSDREAHNVHGRPTLLSAWNFLLSRPGSAQTLRFDKPETGIPVGCDIHPWMRGYLSVLANPFFAVTPASGSVTLSQVPPGKYVIAVWHEKLGTKEQPLTLEPRGAANVQLVFAAGG